MKRNAMGAFALAAAFAGVAASANTLTAFGTYTFDDDATGSAPAASDGTWAVPTGDIAEVTADKYKGDSGKSLAIDAAGEVTFTPSANNADKVSLDVYLTPAAAGADAPDIPQDAKLVVYLDSEGNLKGAKGGDSTYTTIKTGVTGNAWVKLDLAFDGNNATVSVDGVAGTPIASSATTVTSVGFSGTGYVDNFVGTYEYNYAYDNNGGSDTAASRASIEVSGKTVTFNYAGTAAAGTVKFVRVYDAVGNYVTLRTTDNNGTIDATKLKGDVTKVVAFYGDDVSAVPQAAPAVTTASVENNAVTVGLGAALSGVTYSVVDPSGNAISGATVKVGNTTVDGAVPPENDGETLSISVPASQTDWGSVKFKVKVSD